jgi:hypothetical protein
VPDHVERLQATDVRAHRRAQLTVHVTAVSCPIRQD